MKAHLQILCIGAFLTLSSCKTEDIKPYTPSISSLKSSESIIMKLRACHWGCRRGTVVFSGSEAIQGNHRLQLTAEEITILDDYFLLGKSKGGWGCSLPIEISFKLKKHNRIVRTKETAIFPCTSGTGKIEPLSLINYFTDKPAKPYWRLSPEEKNKELSLIE